MAGMVRVAMVVVVMRMAPTLIEWWVVLAAAGVASEASPC